MAHVPAPNWQHVVAPGEELRWTGKPDGQVRLRYLAGYKSLTGLVTMAVVAVIMFAPAEMLGGFASFRDMPIAQLVAAAIAAQGFYSFLPRLFVEAAWNRKTHYALTNRAAYIKSEGRMGRYLPRHALADLELLKVKGVGRDSVHFAEYSYRTSQNGSGSRKVYVSYGFDHIEDAQKVRDMIVEARRAMGRTEAPRRSWFGNGVFDGW